MRSATTDAHALTVCCPQPWRRTTTFTCAGRSRWAPAPFAGLGAVHICGRWSAAHLAQHVAMVARSRPAPTSVCPTPAAACLLPPLQFFLQGNECRLSISGFYYMSVHRCARAGAAAAAAAATAAAAAAADAAASPCKQCFRAAWCTLGALLHCFTVHPAGTDSPPCLRPVPLHALLPMPMPSACSAPAV